MSINAVGFGSGYYSGSNVLSEETRRKLRALGIDPSTVASEAQAQILIAKAQNIQAVQKTVKTNAQNSCTSEQELRYKAKMLALKIGVSIKNETPLEEILKLISVKLEQLSEDTDSKPQKINFINACKEELAQISNQYSVVKQNVNAVYASMNFNADINKMILGL